MIDILLHRIEQSSFFFYLIKLILYIYFTLYVLFPAIKNALKQENLNPEIEEKLLNLQRYQEKQNILHKTHPSPLPNARNSLINHHSTPAGANASAASSVQSPARPPGSTAKRRPAVARHLDDDDWVLDTPRRKPPGAGTMAAVSNTGTPSNIAGSASTSTETSPTVLNKRSIAAKKRESDKKKAAQQAQVSDQPLFIFKYSMWCVWRSQTSRVCVSVECV